MGTKIQSKTCIPGFYSVRDLSTNMSNGLWSLYHDDKILNNDQYDVTNLAWQSMDEYLGYEKERLRETILKHENIFRHQLQELHRVYRRQRELMSEIKRRGADRDKPEAEVFHLNAFSSQIPSRNPKRTWNTSHFPSLESLSYRLSASATDDKQCPRDYEGGKSMHNPYQGKGGPKDCEFLKSNVNLLQKNVLDLQIPASICPNSDNRSTPEIYEFPPASDLYTANRKIEFVGTKDVKAASPTDISSQCNGDDLASNASFNFVSKEFRKESHHGSHPVSFFARLQSMAKTNGKDKLADAFSTEKLIPDGYTSIQSGYSGESSRALQFHQNELTCLPSDGSKAVPRKKGTIFGVEIFGGDNDQQTEDRLTYFGKINQEFSFGLPGRNASSSSHQNGRRLLNRHSNQTSSFWNSNSLTENLEHTAGGMHVNNYAKAVTSAADDLSSWNSPFHGLQLNSNQLRGCSSIESNFINGMSAPTLKSEHFRQHDPLKRSSPPDCIDWKGAKVRKMDMETTDTFQGEMVNTADCQNRQENPEGLLPWFLGKAKDNGMQTNVKENSHHMSLESLQSNSQQFFRKVEMAKASFEVLNQERDTKSIQGAEHGKIEVRGCTKILGFPIFNVCKSSEDAPAASAHCSASCSGANGNDAKNAPNAEPISNQSKSKDLVLENGLDNYMPGLKQQIDLNLSLEEEVPSVSCLPPTILKIAGTEIDLEAPVVLESEVDTKESKCSPEKSKEPHEDVARSAAEAIIAISSSGGSCDAGDVAFHLLEDASGNCLKWFADLVSSYCVNDESKMVEISPSISMDGVCDEDSIPDGMDYFEFMTLNLKDIKEEVCPYKPEIVENPNDEEAEAIVSTRPRRGQARGGRQRKDFQRDILPGLVSLSRHEVTDDLHVIEDMLRASGCAWQSRLSQRSAAAKRKKRHSGGATPSKKRNAPRSAPMKPTICRELSLEEGSLTRWGKRTRRLPRQRCPNGNVTLPSTK